ncbi:NAD(P)H-binding protein [Antarcticibacterium sp. 1MA-6-2]|uniref:NAD(P)H-binding protein n=1 Tax=Antarcticibacterium sp. 1MA-6-2 TaxID=2908210 RepID=UPI001F21253D|nr:NAD(P)H-binding protein [Antarcticibacterium sp. 1MA-6-2]UJH90027.1 NAD(P)H-binding protein [Antarcticibacterium sp. 1MA-6-2]
MKTAILLGATGLTGGILLQKLLNDARYEKIILFSRSSAAVKNRKVEEHLVDLFKLENQKDLFKADVVYCCIGTTKSKTPNEEVYKKIDYGIPVAAAKLARENGIEKFLVISALGADPKSKMFYNKTKGEMEQEVLAQRIPETYIFEPSLIAGDREETRTFENLAIYAMKVLNYALIGPLKKYRSIDPETIAEAMIKVANNGYVNKVIPSNEIQEIAAS